MLLPLVLLLAFCINLIDIIYSIVFDWYNEERNLYYDLVMIIIIHDYKVIKHTQAKRNFIFLIKLLSKITNTT